MPKNKLGGNKAKRAKAGMGQTAKLFGSLDHQLWRTRSVESVDGTSPKRQASTENNKKELEFKEDGQEPGLHKATMN